VFRGLSQSTTKVSLLVSSPPSGSTTLLANEDSLSAGLVVPDSSNVRSFQSNTLLSVLTFFESFTYKNNTHISHKCILLEQSKKQVNWNTGSIIILCNLVDWLIQTQIETITHTSSCYNYENLRRRNKKTCWIYYVYSTIHLNYGFGK
jgi:hypothetical protein